MGADALITIGLTGKYCAGKNHVASLLAQRGLEVIDVDTLGHEALERAKDELTALFGRRIIATDGSVNRKVLGEIVFTDQRSLSALEGTVHPRMVNICIQRLEHYREAGKVGVVVNAALLHRMHLDAVCDTVCFVKAPVLVRLARAMQRDNATIQSFFSIARSQRDITTGMVRGSHSLYIMKNWGSSVFIHRQVDEFCATMGL